MKQIPDAIDKLSNLTDALAVAKKDTHTFTRNLRTGLVIVYRVKHL